MDEKEWSEHLERSKTWNILMGQDLLHSEAYKDLNYGPSVKTLNFFYEKVRLIKIKGKRRSGRNKFERVNSGIVFSYDEAKFRGISGQQFSRALKELYVRGFIDVQKPGSGRRGDCTKFAISNRWTKRNRPLREEYRFLIREVAVCADFAQTVSARL